MSSESLIESSLRVWQKLLDERRDQYPFLRLAQDIDFTQPHATLGTDDFTLLMMAYAEEVGINLHEYGRKLKPFEEREELLKYHAGIALRTVFEVEGHYVEHPYAYTLYKVPTRFLIVMGAVLIGIATGKAAQLNLLLGGAVGGAASLLINILSARYVQHSAKTDLNWTEEFVMRFIKEGSSQSLKDLKKQTKLYKATLKQTLEGLVKKQLIEENKNKGARTTTTYSLKK